MRRQDIDYDNPMLRPTDPKLAKTYDTLLKKLKTQNKQFCKMQEALDSKLEEIEKTEAEIYAVLAESGPIKVGDIIIWEKKTRRFRGEVVSIKLDSGYRTDYQPVFYYRCRILAKSGKCIGTSTVSETEWVRLETDEE